MTADEFRALALGVPGAVESSHMDHPDFRVGGKVFASLGAPDEEWGMVKLTPQEQAEFVRRSPGVFEPCQGAWGRAGCTYVHLETVDEGVLRSAIESASRNVAGRTGARKKG